METKPSEQSASSAMNPPAPNDTFNKAWLSLPLAIRADIFKMCGLVRSKDVLLNQTAVPPICQGQWVESAQLIIRNGALDQCDQLSCCDCNPICNQLFFVCKTLSRDAREFFYSNNAFRLSLDANRTFPILDSVGKELDPADAKTSWARIGCLSPIALMSLRELHFEIGCMNFPLMYSGMDRNSCQGSTMNEAVNMRWNKPLVDEWALLCVRLGYWVASRALDLSLSMDTVSLDVFNAMVGATKKLPVLRHFSVCLGKPFHHDLQTGVHDAVVGFIPSQQSQVNEGDDDIPMTGLSLEYPVEYSMAEDTQRPPLPYDIQDQIFRQSDLVAPGPLNWNCGWEMFDPGRDDGRDFEESCYRASSHVAYSTKFYRWRFPSELFEVHADIARRHFYGCNIFRIEIDWNAEDEREYHETAFLNIFLRAFPHDSLWYLTHIHWHLIDGQDINLLERQEELFAFTQAISMIRVHGRPWKLTISVAIEAYDYDDELLYDEHFLSQKFESYGEFVMRLLPLTTAGMRDQNPFHGENGAGDDRPPRKVKGLANFFVYLDPCFHLSMDDDPEALLERKLMGKNYDSSKRKLPMEMLCHGERIPKPQFEGFSDSE
ncbi:hypothetical protein FE257_003134 [Aspergillus nanangensis]|uniref:Uncharacterized protein n=1 Tax=Aspergillus nanangensis TaxID=2582783 RepID=A0AAD4CC94_ASPNN|nr:hypothetical protein FE257_003134 [Aspergillus nanangensis]